MEMQILFILIIGYGLGNILTGDIVSRIYTKKSAFELGTSHNPGMANITAHIGIIPGILVLLGDILKTVIAIVIAIKCFDGGRMGILYAGLGATLGHNFPFWHHFKGGKGVTTTATTIFLYSPMLAFIALIAGLIVVIVTKYLALGAVVIVFAYMALVARTPQELLVCALFTALMVYRNCSQLKLIPSGQAEKNDILSKFKKKH